jgi:hypothetical protein
MAQEWANRCTAGHDMQETQETPEKLVSEIVINV